MSETNDYIILMYKQIQEKIKMPKNFEEMKNDILQKFNPKLTANFKFSYFHHNQEHIIDENNFENSIAIIKKNEKPHLYLNDDNINNSMIQYNNPNLVLSELNKNESKEKEEDNINNKDCNLSEKSDTLSNIIKKNDESDIYYSKKKQIRENKKNKIEFINKKIKENSIMNKKQKIKLNKDDIIKEENEYIEDIIRKSNIVLNQHNNEINNNINYKLKNEEIDKINKQYKSKIKSIEIELNNKNQIINEMKQKLYLLEKKNNEYNIIIKSYESKLKDNNKIINDLLQEKHKNELLIKKIENLTSQNNQEKEYEIKKKEFYNILESKFEKLYQENINQAIVTLKNNTENFKISLQNKYEINLKNIEKNNSDKFNKIYHFIKQNQNNIKKCKIVQEGIKCNKCFKSPIIGYRYKCITCKDYNLCENCEEENNSQNNFHSHLFIKIINQEQIINNFVNLKQFKGNNNFNINVKNNINNNNIQINNFNMFSQNNNDNNKIIKKNKKKEKEENYSFICVNNNNLKAQINEGENKLNLFIEIKNNGRNKWPMDKVKLVFDEKKNLIGNDIVLQSQNPGEQIKYEIKINDLNMYPIGNYTAGLFFKVNGKTYGEKINIIIVIIKKMENDIKNDDDGLKIIVYEFRVLYQLPIDKYSDEKLLDILIKNNLDYDKAILSLIDNN